MESTIETQLTDAMTAEAARIPAGASDRLARIDYHPRRSRVPVRHLGAVGGAAGVAAATAAALLLTSATPAFGGWTATPRRATPAELADAGSVCGSLLGAMSTSGWAPVTSDVRGSYTLVVYADPSQDYATCLTGPSLGQASLISGSGAGQTLNSASNFGPQPTRSTTTVDLDDSAGLSTYTDNQYEANKPDAYDVADGQVDSDVTAVTLNLSDGQAVDATVGGGWLVAWWPGDAGAVSATVTTPAGTTTVPLT